MEIEDIKELDNSYMVNGNIYVPKDENNKDYKEVKEWLKTNTLTPLLCEEEIEKIRVSDIKAKCKEMILKEYSQSDQLNILASQNSELIAKMRTYIKAMIAISDRAIENKTLLKDIEWVV